MDKRERVYIFWMHEGGVHRVWNFPCEEKEIPSLFVSFLPASKKNTKKECWFEVVRESCFRQDHHLLVNYFGTTRGFPEKYVLDYYSVKIQESMA